jgi:hypothetical protein
MFFLRFRLRMLFWTRRRLRMRLGMLFRLRPCLWALLRLCLGTLFLMLDWRGPRFRPLLLRLRPCLRTLGGGCWMLGGLRMLGG